MPNVILVSFDALRYDHVSQTRNGKETAPFLGSVTSEGIQFTQHISTGSGTSTAFPGIHASSLPLDHGYGGLNENHTSLAEVLSDASVQTLGVTAQTSCSSIYDYDRGFDTFEDWINENSDGGMESSDTDDLLGRMAARLAERIESTPILSSVASELKFQYDGLKDVYDTPACPYPRAKEVTNRSLALIDQNIDPTEDFFVWVHYMEPHAPYYPPSDCVDQFHDGKFDIGRMRRLVRKARRGRPEIIDGSMIEVVSETEIEALRDFYAAATRYVDREAERLVSGLESRGMLEDSLVLFTADHGEELFDRGTFGHRTKMYEELIRVPLILRDEIGYYGDSFEIETVTSHLDLAPTIATHYGVDVPEEWRGVSLVELYNDKELVDREHVFSELCHTSGLGGDVMLDSLVAAVRSDRWKYIQNRQRNTEHLYDLQSDPEEQHNIVNEREEMLVVMQERLKTRLANVSETTQVVDLSADIQRQLKELGYVE